MSAQPTFARDQWQQWFDPELLSRHSLKIVSPLTLCSYLRSVEQVEAWITSLADKLEFPQHATDVFAFGSGPPEKPWHTKVGGLPFRSAAQPWPIRKWGGKQADEPMSFLGQFCLTDSFDILEHHSLQGDLLLVFGDSYHEFHWEWGRIADVTDPLPAADCPVKIRQEFFGLRCRTWDFPDLGPNNRLLASGFKLGGHCPGMDGYFELDRILANFSPFKPVRHAPHPFTNIATPWLGFSDPTYDLYNPMADFTGIVLIEPGEKRLRAVQAKAYDIEPWLLEDASSDLTDYR